MSEHARKLPIDRPCSACSGGDPDMQYHDHEPPFRPEAEPAVPPVPETAGTTATWPCPYGCGKQIPIGSVSCNDCLPAPAGDEMEQRAKNALAEWVERERITGRAAAFAASFARAELAAERERILAAIKEAAAPLLVGASGNTDNNRDRLRAAIRALGSHK